MRDNAGIPKLARFAALRYFAEVAERGSFRAASEAMHIAPSAINRQITNLEQDIGLPLFERARGRSGLKLTEAGHILQLRLRSAMNELRIGSDEINALKGLQRGHVAVGINEGLASTLITKSISAFRQRYPSITFSVFVKNTRDLVASLRDGEVDFVLGYNFPSNIDLVFLKTVVLKMFLAIPAGHPLAARKTVFLSDLDGLDMIIPDWSLIPRQMLELVLRGSNVRLNPIVETNSFELIPLMADMGIGSCIVTSIEGKNRVENRTVFREFDDPSLPSNVLSCCRLPRRGISGAAEAFVVQVCSMLDGVSDAITQSS